MKKKVSIILLISFIVGIILLAGLFIIKNLKKQVLSVDEFISKLEAKEYILKDITREYNYDYVKNVYSAEYLNNWYLNFIQLDNDSNSIKLFDNHYNNYKDVSGPKSMTLVNGLNYNIFTLTTSDYYMYICRVDNTIIYSKANKEYKDEIKEIAKELGY